MLANQLTGDLGEYLVLDRLERLDPELGDHQLAVEEGDNAVLLDVTKLDDRGDKGDLSLR